jgi:hypothetical protein
MNERGASPHIIPIQLSWAEKSSRGRVVIAMVYLIVAGEWRVEGPVSRGYPIQNNTF